MKLSLIVTGVMALAFGACSFDRRPLLPGQEQNATSIAGAGAGDSRDGNGVIVGDSTAPPPHDAGTNDLATRGPTSAALPDGSLAPTALQCQNTFCPVALDPAKVCCTTQADVTQRAARAAGRCGIDLHAVNARAYGTSCWQRDELGIIDDRCPAAMGASTSEPGCCADDGQCGTLNADQKLGCRHAPGSEARSCGDQQQQQPMQTTCDPTGVFALRVVIDAAWGGSSGFFADLTEPGRDKIVIYALVDVKGASPNAGQLDISGHVCGASLPAFYSDTLCEAYQPEFAPMLWESPKLPPLALTAHQECGPLGCTLSIDPVTYLLGIELSNPEAEWPTADETLTLRCPSGFSGGCFPDHDQDNRPGVQVQLPTTGSKPATGGESCKMGYQLRGAPLSETVATLINGSGRRADRVEVGLRVRVGGSSRFAADCNSASGSALAEYIDSRAAACYVQAGTFDLMDPRMTLAFGPNVGCDITEARFIDSNMPKYTALSAGATPDPKLAVADMSPSAGPQLTMVRLGPSAAAISCEQVRGAAF